jgi:hypothetical protein
MEGLAMEDFGIFCGYFVYFVAIWYIFSTKYVPIWVNFGGSCNGRFWYIL